MNDAHLHLLFNHLPIVGSLIGILILAAGIFFKQSMIRKTAFAVLIFSALVTLPAFFTGEGAEEIVEELPGISHNLIHEHEEAAELALWLSETLGILALIAFYLEHIQHKLSGMANLFALIFSIGTFVSFAKTGNTGGEIHHPEISNVVTNTTSDSPPNIQEKEEKED
jgi:uncharacterized membrane protein